MSYVIMKSSELGDAITLALDGISKHRKAELESLKKDYIRHKTTRKFFPMSHESALETWEYHKDEHANIVNLTGGSMEQELLKLQALCEISETVHVSASHARYLKNPYRRWGIDSDGNTLS